MTSHIASEKSAVKRTITLLTDFGDFYPGVMKGVILKIHPDASIIDITHSVKPQNILQGAFLLASYSSFFDNSVHVAVVDPGVGTDRDIIIAEGKNSFENSFFIVPDNGILSGVMDNIGRMFKVDMHKTSEYTGRLSSTFHGRDVFAPAVALTALGRMHEIAEDFGKEPVKIDLFNPQISGGFVECNVAHIDSFGNIITDLKREVVEKLKPKKISIRGVEFPFVETYSDVEVGEPLALIGSFDTLEFSLRNENASEKLGVDIGKITFEFL